MAVVSRFCGKHLTYDNRDSSSWFKCQKSVSGFIRELQKLGQSVNDTAGQRYRYWEEGRNGERPQCRLMRKFTKVILNQFHLPPRCIAFYIQRPNWPS